MIKKMTSQKLILLVVLVALLWGSGLLLPFPAEAQSTLPNPLPQPESIQSPLTQQPQPEHWGLSATAGSGYITLTWQPYNPPSGKVLKGYYVYRSTQPGSASGDRIHDFPLLETSWTDYAVESGRIYYYTVRALYTDGTLSPPSEEVSATATSSTPVVIQLTIGQTQAKVNGIARDLIVPPVIRQGRTMVPLRFIGEAMGAALDWDPVERKVTYTRGDRQVVLWINNPKVIVNGATQYFDPPPFVDRGTTLVPVRLVAEALGFTVLWDEVTQTVTIISSSQVSVSSSSTPEKKPEPSTPLSVPAKLEPPTGFQVTTTRVNKWGQYLVKVSWNPVSGAAAYRVYSSSYLEDWSPWKLEEHVRFLGNSFEIVIDTDHRFYVTAVNQAGEESPPSQIITVNLPVQPVPVQVPPAPTNLHLAADLVPTGEANVYRVILSWDPVGNADTYRIYGFASYWSGYNYLGQTAETSYTYTVAINKDDYWQFYVTAVNSAGESPPSNVITVTTPQTSAIGMRKPEPPTGLHIDSIIPDSELPNSYRVTLSWNPVNNIDSYKVYSRALWIPNSGPVISETQANSYTTSFYVGEGSKSWELYVTAVNAAGESLPSNVITVTLPQTPTITSSPTNAITVTPPQSSTTINITDDFSRDTGLWDYYGDTYRDPQNGNVVLTSNATYSKGVLWLRQEITTPFTVEFSYFAGGGTGGDGLTFMFYKKKYTLVPYGGTLGFDGPGYAIEFDGVENWSDPAPNHIALIKDSTSNHLFWVKDPRVADGRWHRVTVEVYDRVIIVYVDGTQVIKWGGDIERRYGALGFSAATGKLTNRHLIDDVKITSLEVK